jgi:PHP family Zn ribbon phosphoesterase
MNALKCSLIREVQELKVLVRDALLFIHDYHALSPEESFHLKNFIRKAHVSIMQIDHLVVSESTTYTQLETLLGYTKEIGTMIMHEIDAYSKKHPQISFDFVLFRDGQVLSSPRGSSARLPMPVIHEHPEMEGISV